MLSNPESSMSTGAALKKLASNPSFIFITLALSLLYYLISGLSYWGPKYFRDVCGLSIKNTTYIYALISITGPVSGAILSGPLINKFGGYESKSTMPLIISIGVMAIISAVPVSYYNEATHVLISCWFLLFFGGLLLPMATGIMLCTLEPKLKAKGNSVANFSYNLLGWMPAPVVYGWIN